MTEELRRMVWSNGKTMDRQPGQWLSGFHLSCLRARSTLFLDPMMLRYAPDPGAAIAIAIPVEAGSAGRWGAAVAR